MARRKACELSRRGNLILGIVMLIVAFVCVYPIILLFMISFSSESSILQYGYRLIPAQFSLEAYRYIFKVGSQIAHSYMITIIVTVVGTIFSMLLSTIYAYAISREDFKYRKFFTFYALLPYIFTAGWVPFYIVSVHLYGFKNSMMGLIMPLAMNGFYILILRSYFKTQIHPALIEAARIDGAGEFRIFYQIVVPLAKPGIATISLLTAVGYWNDFWDPLLFINKASLTPIQLLLQNTQNNLQFIINNASSLGMNSAEMLRNMPTQTAIFAIVILATIPILCAYPFFQKYVVAGMTVGGVKD